MADCQDRDIGRGLGGIRDSGLVDIIARRLNPFLETGQHSLRGLLRRGVAFVRTLYDGPQAPFDFIGGQSDIREHEAEEPFHR